MKRVLVVEDDSSVLACVTRIFRDRGYEVDSAPNCTGGIHLAQSSTPSLFLLDVGLPDGSGIDLCRYIRAESGSHPIIVYSGDDSNETAALRAEANAFVPKGLTMEELLNQALDGFEQVSSPERQVA